MQCIKIILCCPQCGGANFIPDDDGLFRCEVCGEISAPEMTAKRSNEKSKKVGEEDSNDVLY